MSRNVKIWYPPDEPPGGGCEGCNCQEREPTIHEAAAAFREEFHGEPWFVRLLLPPSDNYIVAVVDGRYFPISKKVKLDTPWLGFPVAVARLQGCVATAERAA